MIRPHDIDIDFDRFRLKKTEKGVPVLEYYRGDKFNWINLTDLGSGEVSRIHNSQRHI